MQSKSVRPGFASALIAAAALAGATTLGAAPASAQAMDGTSVRTVASVTPLGIGRAGSDTGGGPQCAEIQSGALCYVATNTKQANAGGSGESSTGSSEKGGFNLEELLDKGMSLISKLAGTAGSVAQAFTAGAQAVTAWSPGGAAGTALKSMLGG